jgi:hypothetical protein
MATFFRAVPGGRRTGRRDVTEPGTILVIMVSDDAAWRVAVTQIAGHAWGPPLDRTLRVTVHFHPDRVTGDGRTVLEALRDGLYRSQFETGISNGGLTAHPGGDRWRWESRIFAGVYDDAPPQARPKYGSLNHRRRLEGGSIRFGSAHLVLAESTLERTTFCWPDSVFEPSNFGTVDRMALIALADAADADRLDDYIEAHLHGPLRLGTDVEALILDPSFRGTQVEALADTLPVDLGWHRGFRLRIDALAEHAGYRGPEVARLGRLLAEDGWLDARVIGIAANTGSHDPQLIKKLWHCVARFGVQG